MKVIGLMSGTSGDGVDAALVDIRGRGEHLTLRSLAFYPFPYSRSLRQRVLAASTEGRVAEICHLNALLGELFAKAALGAIQHAGLCPSDVHLIGSHGQTVHHLPQGHREPGVGLVRSTLQIAEPAVIAERTGITTVADFRPRDMAAGGEGAPLTPYVHHLLFRHPRRSRLIVNLGGISNVTYLPRGGTLDSLRAFDTGPGNMALDAVASHMTHGRVTMDRGGNMARRGQVDAGLLAELLGHPFLTRRPPKSTGREEFGDAFLRTLFERGRRRRILPQDLLATCTRWTAEAVGTARRWLRGPIDEVLVGGGGIYNKTVMAHLGEVFAPARVLTFDDAGWQSKAFEAMAFAVLAYQTVKGHSTNVPSVTGATRPVLLGTIVPGDARWLARLRRLSR